MIDIHQEEQIQPNDPRWLDTLPRELSDLERFRSALKKIVDMKDSVTRASIREFAAEVLNGKA